MVRSQEPFPPSAVRPDDRANGTGFAGTWNIPATLHDPEQPFMLTPEEVKVLTYVRDHLTTTVADLAHACTIPGQLITRLLSQLEWFNYVVVYHDRAGTLIGVQITEAGTHCARQFASQNRRSHPVTSHP
jgi:DNA-binding MarR family transcriptional regulator